MVFSKNYNQYIRKPSKFRRFLLSLKLYWWTDFWYTKHFNGVYSNDSEHYKTFKTTNLALVITLVTLVLYIFFHD